MPKDRIHSLDLLRGFFVFLALWQHFCSYINFWYLDFHGGWEFWGNLFEPHALLLGEQLRADEMTSWTAWFFTPWGSQIYLFLAAFNLAKNNTQELKQRSKEKFFHFFILFLLFTFENFLVAPNIGEAFSLYPLQAWMLILGIILLFDVYGGEKMIWIIFGLSFLRFVFPDVITVFIEQFMRDVLHKNFEIDARLDYFLGSGALGFLLGRSWWRDRERNLLRWLLAGLMMWPLWIFAGKEFTIMARDLLATEHDVVRTFIGSIGIYGIEITIVVSALLLYSRGFDIRVPIFNWIGRYSLLVFFLHRIVFLEILMPLRMLIFNIFDIPIRAIFFESWIFILLVVGMAWMIRKMRILTLLEGRE